MSGICSDRKSETCWENKTVVSFVSCLSQFYFSLNKGWDEEKWQEPDLWRKSNHCLLDELVYCCGFFQIFFSSTRNLTPNVSTQAQESAKNLPMLTGSASKWRTDREHAERPIRSYDTIIKLDGACFREPAWHGWAVVNQHYEHEVTHVMLLLSFTEYLITSTGPKRSKTSAREKPSFHMPSVDTPGTNSKRGRDGEEVEGREREKRERGSRRIRYARKMKNERALCGGVIITRQQIWN